MRLQKHEKRKPEGLPYNETEYKGRLYFAYLNKVFDLSPEKPSGQQNLICFRMAFLSG